LESACAFILRAGSKTLSTWNSCMCHPYIIFGDARRDQPSPEVGIGCAKLGKTAYECDCEHPALRWSLLSRREPPTTA
jgi:hypothetical protein